MRPSIIPFFLNKSFNGFAYSLHHQTIAPTTYPSQPAIRLLPSHSDHPESEFYLPITLTTITYCYPYVMAHYPNPGSVVMLNRLNRHGRGTSRVSNTGLSLNLKWSGDTIPHVQHGKGVDTSHEIFIYTVILFVPLTCKREWSCEPHLKPLTTEAK